MAHIHTGPGQYDLTVSMYILRLADSPRLLMHRHKTLGVWLQPGGHVELDETPWQAVAHELREETGYDLDQLCVLQPPLAPPDPYGDVLHPQPVCLRSFPFGVGTNHFHTDLCFAFVADADPRHPIGVGESPDLVWLTRQELSELPQMYEDARQIGMYIFDFLLEEWVRVPASQFSLAAP